MSPNADILNYQGNAGLALGSTSGAEANPVYGNWDFGNEAATAFTNLAKRVNEVKDTERKQAIADRDKIFGEIAKMNMDMDKVLPEDRPRLIGKIKEAEQLYLENPDLNKNRDAFVKMQGLLREFNELNAYAKTNYTQVTEDLIKASKLEDPEDRKSYMDHIGENRKKIQSNPFELYMPYQNPLKMDYDAMAPAVTPTKVKTGEEDGFLDVNRVYTDPNKMIENYNWGVVEGKDRKMRNMWQEFDKNYLNDNFKSPTERVQEFELWNKKIDAANKYMDANVEPKPGEMGPVQPKKLKKIRYDNNTGMPIFDDDFTADDFHRSAYVALRFNEGVQKDYNEDRAKAGKTQAEIDKAKAAAAKDILEGNAARTRALNDGKLKGSQISLNDARTKKILGQLETEANQKKWSYAYLAASLPTTTVKLKDGNAATVIALKDMPKPLQSLTADYNLAGKKNSGKEARAITPYKTQDGIEYYTFNTVKDSYIISDGTVMTKQDILGRNNSEYLKAKKNKNISFSKEYPNGTEEDFVKYFIEKMNAKPELVIQGQDGSATTGTIHTNQIVRDNQNINQKQDEHPEGM